MYNTHKTFCQQHVHVHVHVSQWAAFISGQSVTARYQRRFYRQGQHTLHDKALAWEHLCVIGHHIISTTAGHMNLYRYIAKSYKDNEIRWRDTLASCRLMWNFCPQKLAQSFTANPCTTFSISALYVCATIHIFLTGNSEFTKVH